MNIQEIIDKAKRGEVLEAWEIKLIEYLKEKESVI